MVALILKELKKWEACELNKTTAEDILHVVEDAGMIPPFVSRPMSWSFDQRDWEPEAKNGIEWYEKGYKNED